MSDKRQSCANPFFAEAGMGIQNLLKCLSSGQFLQDQLDGDPSVGYHGFPIMASTLMPIVEGIRHVMIDVARTVGFLGGPLAYWFLKRYWPAGDGVPMSTGDPYAAAGFSKLRTMFGSKVIDELRGKVVLDFGCGEGQNAIELAQMGCARVIGLDIQEHHLQKAKLSAEAVGVGDRCVFTPTWSEPVDVIVSTDAFEHFDEPDRILHLMRGLVKENGYLLVEFGYPWYHPYGGHLFSVFPWAHLLFTESALIRWRSDFKTDGATRFHEVAGGLNQMTVRRWERLVAGSGFEFVSYQLVPIRAARRLHCFVTREFLTSTVRALLTPIPTHR